MSARKPSADDVRGMAWWNALDEAGRRYWLEVAKSSRPVDAWRRFKAESVGGSGDRDRNGV